MLYSTANNPKKQSASGLYQFNVAQQIPTRTATLPSKYTGHEWTAGLWCSVLISLPHLNAAAKRLQIM